uniref:Putative mitochondrial carnitine-acylcarnitine carrier protein n=1 Tax=Ixodes ricinus TaxID=34613 RepID=A0A0K8RE13_IXORI
MTHNEERTHWIKEGAIGLGVGVLYGVTNVCVGHPFDTIKTKMQAQAGFESCSMYQSFRKTLKTGGRRWVIQRLACHLYLDLAFIARYSLLVFVGRVYIP